MLDPTGQTPNEIARFLRKSPDWVRSAIKRGELGAINLGATGAGKPQYRILPQHLEAFLSRRAVHAPPSPAPRRRRVVTKDYYPE